MSSPLLDHPSFDQFLESLKTSFDIDTNLRVYHVSTPPVSTTPIFASPPGQSDEATTCESHFLTVSHVITPANPNHPPTNHDDSGKTAGHAFILGIEVLIFSTESSTTIFVSKADSTGFLERSPTRNTKQGSPSVIRVVISTFLKWLVSWQLSLPISESADTDHVREEGSGQIERRRRPRRLVLSLFARSQNQYLFPGSIENTTKHVLDDRQLIKWWCRLLDELVQINWTKDAKLVQNGLPDTTTPSKLNSSTTAYVVVPGCDRSDTIRSFFPTSAKQAGITATTWHNSYPVELLVSQDQSSRASLPVRCSIPRLPDDPKARYCNDLDGAGIDENGRWRDIRSLQQFWETMEYRQECAAGRLVGFVWVVFNTGYDGQHTAVEGQSLADTETTTRATNGTQNSVTVADAVGTPGSTLPKQTGSVMVTSEQYIVLSDLLINDADFAGADLAIKSTQEWIDKVKELADLQCFGVDIQGSKATHSAVDSTNLDLDITTQPTTGVKHPRDEGGATVNILTAVRKKKQRTAESTDINGRGSKEAEHVEHNESTSAEKHTTNIVDQKAQTPNDSSTTTGTTTLSAGLIRKIQKPQPSNGNEMTTPS